MHYTETVVSLDRLDKLDLSCQWNVSLNTVIHAVEILSFLENVSAVDEILYKELLLKNHYVTYF